MPAGPVHPTYEELVAVDKSRPQRRLGEGQTQLFEALEGLVYSQPLLRNLSRHLLNERSQEVKAAALLQKTVSIRGKQEVETRRRTSTNHFRIMLPRQ